MKQRTTRKTSESVCKHIKKIEKSKFRVAILAFDRMMSSCHYEKPTTLRDRLNGNN